MQKGVFLLQNAQKKAKEADKARNAAAESAKAKEAAKGGNKKQTDKGNAKEADPDPDGTELASTSAPLEEASKLLQSLREHAGNRLKTQTLSFEVRPSALR